MLVTGEFTHVAAHFGGDNQGGRHINAINARQIHSAHLKKLGAQIKLRCVAGVSVPFLPVPGPLAALQGLHLRLDLRITLGQLGAIEVKRIQGLLECKGVLGAPVTSPSPPPPWRWHIAWV